MSNAAKLRHIMQSRGLKTRDVAVLLGRKENTVRVWRMTKSPRPIPDNELELLDLKTR